MKQFLVVIHALMPCEMIRWGLFLHPLPWSHVTRNHTIAGARNEVISSFRIKRSCFLRPVFCSFPFGLEMMFAFHLSRVNKAARAFACEKLHSLMRFPSLSSSSCLLLVLRLRLLSFSPSLSRLHFFVFVSLLLLPLLFLPATLPSLSVCTMCAN